MFLGLDLGTTNVKALVVADDGAIEAEGSAPVPLHHVTNGRGPQTVRLSAMNETDEVNTIEPTHESRGQLRSL